MVNIQDIRKFMSTWKQMTYRKGLDYCYSIKNDQKVFDLCVEVILEQNLTDKFMDGYSVQNIPIIKEDKTRVIFTKYPFIHVLCKYTKTCISYCQ